MYFTYMSFQNYTQVYTYIQVKLFYQYTYIVHFNRTFSFHINVEEE